LDGGGYVAKMGEKVNACRTARRKPKGKSLMEYQDIDGMIILKLIL
jgi:hypothetical protein